MNWKLKSKKFRWQNFYFFQQKTQLKKTKINILIKSLSEFLSRIHTTDAPQICRASCMDKWMTKYDLFVQTKNVC